MSTSSSQQERNGAPSYKRAKLSHLPPSTKTIGTHSGTFQADEALGVWLLRQLPLYRRSPVVRSRDPAVLEGCDIVIDVGGIYDHSKLRYDHHQRGYDERFPPRDKGDGSAPEERCTKLSASGLVYRHYGREVIAEHYPQLKSLDGSESSELEWVYNKIYGTFMEAIDAIDTGVEPISSDAGDLQLQYRDSTGLSSRVGRTNPRWNEVDEASGSPPNPDSRFEIASDMCGDDFLGVLTKIVEGDLPARSIVEEAVRNRYECDASGEIICLPSGGLPWKGQVYELEREHALAVPIKYVLYTDQAGMWRIQCVSVEGKAFENRLSLPADWRGVRDGDLSGVAGIEGCTFCHASGFIGGNKSYEGVLEMARVALKVGKSEAG
eukprot:CAMPEP_0172548328 /NCGR_PEP_ID=MMETSP1067-20121228/17640_1 /TAXON_ID=265564 ORGANISM="Thalassiosira punctigera, Strain Tpunct2005C2" /NCGR_SAMPLE_ID=MMETSP1067 /ASSEMBLY_ACC=CAM_ASM_000444 /LENGTH=378 /DNA_ID=CAMNT_0013335531 /DNA_START=297 /DNA_END=1433 /DNA_ORIENTATION=-